MSAIEYLLQVSTSETVFGIPSSHTDKQLANFDWCGHERIAEAIRDFMQRVEAGDAPHLLLLGPVGTGKTHIAVGLYRWAVFNSSTLHSMFVPGQSFYDEVKKTYGAKDEPDPLDDVRAATYLVALDDPLAQGKLHPGDRDILFKIVNAVHSNHAALVWTMNDTLEALTTYFNPHESDRILDRVIVCEFSGESRRG